MALSRLLAAYALSWGVWALYVLHGALGCVQAALAALSLRIWWAASVQAGIIYRWREEARAACDEEDD